MEQKLGFLNILRLIVNSSILTLFEMSRIVVDFAKHFVIATIAKEYMRANDNPPAKFRV